MTAICQHRRLRTTCGACRPNPKAEYLKSIGPVEPHALIEERVWRERLPHIEHLGVGNACNHLRLEEGKDFHREHKKRYPGPREWKWLTEQVRQRDGHKCCVCGSRNKLQVDHIWPLSKGGENRYRNLWTLCAPCHSTKTGKNGDPFHWRKTPAQKVMNDLLRDRPFTKVNHVAAARHVTAGDDE